MHDELRLSIPAARVLRVFLEDPDEPRYGYDLMEQVGLASGSLYPILARFERAGLIRGAKEDVDPRVEGRPARRNFVLTAEGLRFAYRNLAELGNNLMPPMRQWRAPGVDGGRA